MKLSFGKIRSQIERGRSHKIVTPPPNLRSRADTYCPHCRCLCCLEYFRPDFTTVLHMSGIVKSWGLHMTRSPVFALISPHMVPSLSTINPQTNGPSKQTHPQYGTSFIFDDSSMSCLAFEGGSGRAGIFYRKSYEEECALRNKQTFNYTS